MSLPSGTAVAATWDPALLTAEMADLPHTAYIY